MQRVVIVTPSVYGTDNSATLLGMQARGKDARGVAVIDDKTTDAELDRLAKLGFKGIRLNLSTAGVNDPTSRASVFSLPPSACKSRNWHVQLNTNLPVIAAMKDALAASPVPIVFDHYGGAKRALGVQQPGFSDLVDLVRSGKAYVKISVHCRSASELRVLHAARANADRRQRRSVRVGYQLAASEFGERQHGKVTPLWQVDDGLVLNLLPVWAPDAVTRKKILVDNPARLYEF